MTDPFAVPTARQPSPLALVNAVRAEVDAWRDGGYPGASATTRRLLEHWFLDQHRTTRGQPFAYYFAQREAIETIVYLHEVAGVRSTDGLLARYPQRPVAAAGQPFPRYVVKMATGSGKTKVMSLAIAWAYFHAIREEGSALSPTSLVVAPNLIVFERLREDFEDGRIFRRDPVLPPEWRTDFDLQVVLRDEQVPMTSTGVLALTNVHVLYDRTAKPDDNPVQRLLGPTPPASVHAFDPPLRRLAERGTVMVVNDEAHHLHDEVRADTGEPLVAVRTIQRLHELSDGVVAQLDFSATPRNQQGQPFAEIVCDYPLAAAIDDGIVKRPVIGELSGDLEVPSDDASVRYRQRLGAAVARWREDTERLAPLDRNPLLFVMAEDTAAADQIAQYLDTLPDLTGRVLTIHVNLSGRGVGDIRKDDLEEARRFARSADDPDQPYRAIVSVLMLREGWDVRNVTVIVPLRPYTASARILPEQTLGRGLRRITPPGSGVEERVVIIEHEAFRALWDTELAELGIELERRAPEDLSIPAVVITPEPERATFDIEVPQLTRQLQRSSKGLEQLRLEDLPRRSLRLPELSGEEANVEYRGRDLRSGEIVEEATYPLPHADDPFSVLAWYVHEIQRESRLTGQFHLLAPLFHDYVEQRAFAGPVSLDDPAVLHALAEPAAQETLFEVFRAAVDAVTLVDQPVRAERQTRPVSDTRPFLWSGETAVAERSVFNLQPCDSGLEVQLCGLLDRWPDVAAFAKLTPASRLSMEYRTTNGRLAYYYPDFVARDTDGLHMLVETKGRTDIGVPEKDRRAVQWAVDATLATGVRWSYARVDQDLLERHAGQLRSLEALVHLVRARRREEFRSREPAGPLSRQEHLRLMDEASRRITDSGTVPDIDQALQRFREDPSA
jgi:type III restriction enzyme